MSTARARLFVALELPSTVRDGLWSWCQQVSPACGEALRPVPVQSLHVTLCFLGSLPEAAIPAVAEVCQAVADFPAAALELGQALWLPPARTSSGRRPRVLAVGLQDHDGALGDVQRKLSRALAAGGWYEPEQRPFLPHVTVARVRRGASELLPPLPATPEASVEWSTLALMRSRPRPGGVRYERLRSVTLVSGGRRDDAIASRAAVGSAGRRHLP